MLSTIKNILPHRCAFCTEKNEGQRICRRCISALPWNDTFCECCGQPVLSSLPPGVPCAACQQRVPAYAKARSPLRYAFPVDTALKAMKFRGHLVYAPAFASLMLPILESEFRDCDALAAVPLHRWRHITRGFNQAAELCTELVAATNLPIIGNAIRVRPTKTQSGLSSAMRRENLRGAFAIRGNLNARYPLIIDDVITTGATCERLARALLDAGAEKVGVLTVARSSTLVN